MGGVRVGVRRVCRGFVGFVVQTLVCAPSQNFESRPRSSSAASDSSSQVVIRQLPLRRRCWRPQCCATLCKLSRRESCCKLAEAAIGGHDTRRMSVLAAAELAGRSLSCCICTPYQRASRLSVHDLRTHVVVGNRSCSAHGPSGPSTARS